MVGVVKDIFRKPMKGFNESGLLLSSIVLAGTFPVGKNRPEICTSIAVTLINQKTHHHVVFLCNLCSN